MNPLDKPVMVQVWKDGVRLYVYEEAPYTHTFLPSSLFMYGLEGLTYTQSRDGLVVEAGALKP